MTTPPMTGIKPGVYNFICPQGATFAHTLTWTVNKIPVNLDTYTARMQVRERYKSPNFIVSIDTENGGVSLEEDGKISIFIPDDITKNIVAKSYVYDLEVVSSSIVTRLLEGKFIVTPEVTK
jgi:hypothetical protein